MRMSAMGFAAALALKAITDIASTSYYNPLGIDSEDE
jgi:hypothetical protein